MKTKTAITAYGPNFCASRYESFLIRKIVDRAVKNKAYKRDKLSTEMDLEACHCNGTPLDLTRLLNAPEFDFWHDLSGIRYHLNRDTGKLMDCFLPRMALQDGR